MDYDKAIVINSLRDMVNEDNLELHSMVMHIKDITAPRTATLLLHKNYFYNIHNPKNVVIALTNIKLYSIDRLKIKMDEIKYGIDLPQDRKENMVIKLNEIIDVLSSDYTTARNTFVYFVNNKIYDNNFTINIDYNYFIDKIMPETPSNIMFIIRNTSFDPYNFSLNFDLTDTNKKKLTDEEQTTIIKYQCPEVSSTNKLLITSLILLFIFFICTVFLYVKLRRST